jgi:hypothetical protein
MNYNLSYFLSQKFSNGMNYKILDIGPGYKDYLTEFGFSNVKRDVIDFDPEVINFQKKCSNVEDIFVLNLDSDFDLVLNKKYDVIFLFEVLEQVDLPFLFVNKLSNLLNSGGQIFFSVPTHYSESLMKRVNKEYNSNSLYPHVNFFSKRALFVCFTFYNKFKINFIKTINFNFLFYHLFLNIFTKGYDVNAGKVHSKISTFFYLIFISFFNKLNFKTKKDLILGRNYFGSVSKI